MILWSTPKWVLVIGHYDNKFYIVIFKTAIKMAIIRTANQRINALIGAKHAVARLQTQITASTDRPLPAILLRCPFLL